MCSAHGMEPLARQAQPVTLSSYALIGHMAGGGSAEAFPVRPSYPFLRQHPGAPKLVHPLP